LLLLSPPGERAVFPLRGFARRGSIDSPKGAAGARIAFPTSSLYYTSTADFIRLMQGVSAAAMSRLPYGIGFTFDMK
jgi:hypothetical protein